MAKKTAPTPEMLTEARKNIITYIAFCNIFDHDTVADYAYNGGYRKMDVRICSDYYLEKHWLKGDGLKYNQWNARTEMDERHRFGIIAFTSLYDVQKIENFNRSFNFSYRAGYDKDFLLLTKAFNAYCRMKPVTMKVFQEDMDDFVPVIPSEEEMSDAAAIWEETKKKLRMSESIDSRFANACSLLLHYVCFHEFISALPITNIYDILYDYIEMSSYFGQMNRDSYDTVHSMLKYSEDQADPFTHHSLYDKSYLLGVFFKEGNIDKALAEMHSDTFFYSAVVAMKQLQEGQPNEAFRILEQAFKRTGGHASTVEYINFIWGLSLLQSDLAAAQKRAEVLSKKKEIVNCSSIPVLKLLLQMKVHPETDFKQWIENQSINTFLTPVERSVFAMICRHYNYKVSMLKKFEDVLPDVVDLQVNVLALDLANEYDNLGIDSDQLQKKLQMHAFLPKFEKKEDWEIILNTLMTKFGSNKNVAGKASVKKDEISRVSYLVNPRFYNVIPRLQKSKNDGQTWSNGRNIALTTFMKPMPEKTTQDMVVSKMVDSHSYGWYGNLSYDLSGEKVIEALIGHPYVFMEDNPDLKIDIESEKLQIEVRDTGSGFKVVHNAVKKGGKYQTLSIIQQSPQLYKVLRLKDDEKEILELLDRIYIFPKGAKEQLTRLLEALGSKVSVVSALLKDSETVVSKKGDSKITMQLIPYGDEFTARCYVKPVEGCPPYCKPGKGLEFIATTIKGKAVQVERNRKKEQANMKAVEDLMQPFAEFREEEGWTIPIVECLELLDLMRQHPDTCSLEWPEGVRLKVQHPMLHASNLKLTVNGMNHWFSVDGDIQIDEKLSMKVSELLKRVREAKGNFIEIGDNEYVALNQQLKKYLASLDHVMQAEKKQLKVSQYNCSFLKDLESLGAELNVDSSYTDLVKNLNEADEMKFPVPKMLQADLRDYQNDGYRWLSRLAHWGAGACLADDMGLGKTIQTIALLLSHAKNGASLVIMPTSVLMNWRDEIMKFAPSLNTIILRSATDREEAVKNAGPQDIVLSTYGLLPSEEELLKNKTWNIIVLDEAHTIKNKETKTSKVAMQLEGKFRLLLTGTPLQNHLSEIWNLFQFATPGLLTNYTQFTQEFITPIERDQDKERQRLLKKILSPFILRRTKNEVLNELPEKTEITLKVELTDAERALYERFRDEAILNLEDGSITPIQALAELTRLRQTACNAALVLPKKEAESIPSSKMETFLKLVEELQQNHHRALVFSQFTSHLALVQAELKKRDIAYQYLDGSTTPTDRLKRVDEFQKGDMPLFLISLKAGGTGLNLTAADYVIHLDPWWNPAIEDQASDRAYRIGQDKPVTVYRLIAENTIEEKILALHQTKKSLADALLEGSDMNHTLSKDEILSLLKICH